MTDFFPYELFLKSIIGSKLWKCTVNVWQIVDFSRGWSQQKVCLLPLRLPHLVTRPGVVRAVLQTVIGSQVYFLTIIQSLTFITTVTVSSINSIIYLLSSYIFLKHSQAQIAMARKVLVVMLLFIEFGLQEKPSTGLRFSFYTSSLKYQNIQLKTNKY